MRQVSSVPVPRCSHTRLPQAGAALLMTLVAVTGCSEGGGISRNNLSSDLQGRSDLARVYHLGVGDKVKVTVFGEPDLSGTFEVNAAGSVPVPLVGDVAAKGRGINEFRDAVAQKLAQGYLKTPRVSVEVLNFRPFYVHGEVRNGGEFAFKNGLRIRDAVAVAGGFTYRADQSYVIMTREGSPGEIKVSMAGDFEVLPGDNIRIPERFF